MASFNFQLIAIILRQKIHNCTSQNTEITYFVIIFKFIAAAIHFIQTLVGIHLCIYPTIIHTKFLHLLSLQFVKVKADIVFVACIHSSDTISYSGYSTVPEM